jgi:hypothetical protein
MNKKKAEPEKSAKGLGSQSGTPEVRYNLIAVSAYYRAEKRGFAPGREMQDWFEAEAEIADRFSTTNLPQDAE